MVDFDTVDGVTIRVESDGEGRVTMSVFAHGDILMEIEMPQEVASGVGMALIGTPEGTH